MAENVKKVSVAIGREELAWARKRAKRERRSVSSVLTEAVRRVREEEARRARQREAWESFLDWATADEPLTDEELDGARDELAE